MHSEADKAVELPKDWPFFPEPEPEAAEEVTSFLSSTYPSSQATIATADSTRETNVEKSMPFIPGFVLESVAGRGSMSVVYRALQIDLNRTVALKVMKKLDAHSDSRFMNEAEAMARVSHPNIVPIYLFGRYRQRAYLVFEFALGTLAGFLQVTGLIPSKVAAAGMLPLLSALDYLHHQKIVHRDIKPGNILITGRKHDSVLHPYSDVPRHDLLQQQLKLSDFGLVRHPDYRDVDAGNLTGTPCYLAPEIITSGANDDPRSDVYSMGIVLYEMLTGTPPFIENSLNKTLDAVEHKSVPDVQVVNHEVPDKLADICHHALAKDPDERYQSARSFADDLLRFLNDKPIQARPRHRLKLSWLASIRRLFQR
jgi:eukaryotic-like serine/threonine-protein kinase